jgi:spore maturation protein CgeB
MTWYHNLYEPLLDLGHDVVLLRMDEVANSNEVTFRSKKYKEIFSNHLVTIFKKEQLKKPFDLFISYVTDLDVDVNILKEIKTSGVPMANFSCNNTHQFHLVEKISPVFEYNLHSEKDSDIKFRNIGATPVWFPMAANPNHYFPTKIPFNYDATFIGAAYAKRSYYIWHLLGNGININCFGPNWKINQPNAGLKKVNKETKRLLFLVESIFSVNAARRHELSSTINTYDLQNRLRNAFTDYMHYPLSDPDVLKVYNQSRINLGFLEVNSNDESSLSNLSQHLHLREFEIPMSGGLYITNFSEELSEFYELGKEVLVFYNEYDLADKIKYYLKHEDEASQVRFKGHQRALKCHSYQTRFSNLFNKLNLS